MFKKHTISCDKCVEKVFLLPAVFLQQAAMLRITEMVTSSISTCIWIYFLILLNVLD